MDLITVIAISIAAGVLGGALGHALRMHIAPQAGTPEDHEERLSQLESAAVTIQRAEKARRMRELRSTKAENETALAGGTATAQESFPVMASPADIKAQLRRRVFGRSA